MTPRSFFTGSMCFFLYVFPLLLTSGCNGFLPASGPSTSATLDAGSRKSIHGIQVIEVTDSVARALKAKHTPHQFSELLASPVDTTFRVGSGDVVEVSLWEAPPAALFGIALGDLRSGSATTRAAVFPEQMINTEGTITIPFAGKVKAAGRTLQQIAAEIEHNLQGKANQPQVLVRLTRNLTSNVTLVGELGTSARMPLTPKGERLLDALASAGGTRQPADKMTIQITRGDKVYAMPLETIIRDPRQNIVLQPNDVVTALYQPLSFTALGAVAKNAEINFEAQGITLAQSLARSASLQDIRSDAQGVFVFRFEDADALDWPSKPVLRTPDDRVPVVYRFNLRDPACFLLAQNFMIKNKDVLYVSNAPATELQKFLNLITSITYPLTNALITVF